MLMKSEHWLGMSAAAAIADLAFLFGGDEAPGLVGEVLDGRSDDRATMRARQDSKIAKLVEVATDCLWGDFEAGRQLFDGNPTDGPG